MTTTAHVTQHNAKCDCGMNMPLMPGMVGTTCKNCNVEFSLPELTFGLDVRVVGRMTAEAEAELYALATGSVGATVIHTYVDTDGTRTETARGTFGDTRN